MSLGTIGAFSFGAAVRHAGLAAVLVIGACAQGQEVPSIIESSSAPEPHYKIGSRKKRRPPIRPAKDALRFMVEKYCNNHKN